MTVNPELEHLTYQVRTKAWEDPDAALQEFRTKGANFLFDKKYTAQNPIPEVMAAKRKVGTLDPETLSKLDKSLSSTTREGRQFAIDWVNQNLGKTSTLQPTPLKPQANEGMVASALDKAAWVGKTIKHELQPLEVKKGMQPPNLENIRAQRLSERERRLKEEYGRD